MKKILLAALTALSLASIAATPSYADPQPRTVYGRCARATGGPYNPATRRWDIVDYPSFTRCIDASGSHEPRTIRGQCARDNGGHHVPGTRSMWATNDVAAFNNCINAAALREAHAMMRK